MRTLYFLSLVVLSTFLGFKPYSSLASLQHHLNTVDPGSCRKIFNSKYQPKERLTPEAKRNIRNKKNIQRETFLPLVEEFLRITESELLKIPEFAAIERENIRMSNINPSSKDHAREEIQLTQNLSIQRTDPTTALQDYKDMEVKLSGYLQALGQQRYRSNLYLWRDLPHDSKTPKSVFEYVPTTVGLNPPVDYYKLIVTTSVLLKILEENTNTLNLIATRIDQSEVEFGRKHSGIGTIDELQTTGNYALLTLIEGLVSLHQYLGFLIGDKTPGVPSSEIVRQLLQPNSHTKTQGRTMMSGLTQMLPMALIGPVTLKGIFFLGPFHPTPAGEIRPSTNFINFMMACRDYAIPFVNKKEGTDHSTCMGCPVVGGKRGGIDMLSEAYLMVYSAVSEIIDQKAD